MEDLGGSWELSELAKSRFIGFVGVLEAHKSRSVVPVGVWRPPRMLRHGFLTSGRPTNHDQSSLSVSGGLPECSEVTIYRACRCLEASQGALAWLLDVFGSSTSSSWRILEALGGCRSLQNQDSSALSVCGRLTSHDLSCLSVSGGFPECSEVTIDRACRCLEASRMAS